MKKKTNLLAQSSKQFDTLYVLSTFFDNLSQLTPLDTIAVIFLNKEENQIYAPHFHLPQGADKRAVRFTKKFQYKFSKDIVSPALYQSIHHIKLKTAE